MITIYKCRKLGLEKQFNMLHEQMKRNREIFSGHECKKDMVFSDIYVENALSNFGVDFNSVKGKKWFEFYKNDWEVKVYNSLRLIKVQNTADALNC